MIRALLLVERARLQEHTIGDPDLADVVEDRAQADRLDLVGPQPQQLGDADGERGEPLAVAVEVRVARLDRVRERARERRCEQPLAHLVAAARRALEGIGDRGLEVGVANGLVTRPAAPRVSAWLSVSYVPAPVTRTTGSEARRLCTASSSSRPERPGMITSLTTRSNSASSSSSSARSALSAPVDVVTRRLEDLDDQACGSPPRRRSRGCGSSGCLLGDREPQGERRAVPVSDDAVSVPPCDSAIPRLTDRPSPVPPVSALRREERLEDALERRSARCPGPSSLTTAITRVAVPADLDAHAAAVRHRLARVRDQVEEDLLQLVRARVHERAVVVVGVDQLDALVAFVRRTRSTVERIDVVERQPRGVLRRSRARSRAARARSP